MPLADDYHPKVGTRLIYTPTQLIFTVLCNCPQSSPRFQTKRFIEAHRHLYDLPSQAPPPDQPV
jgi:hypothetical protein